MTQSWLNKLVSEPLIHFLIAGAALFFVMGRFGGEDNSGRSITIDENQVAALASQWEQTWRRPPDASELDNLIRDHIKGEVYFREAMRLGLDADDPIIRRRLRTKMEFLATTEAENIPPTEAELTRYYATNKARYAKNPAYSFEQRYYGDDEAEARDAVAALNAGKSPPVLIISLPPTMKSADANDIAKKFGDGFAAGLAMLPYRTWAGPVQSGYGWHAVRVNDVTASKIPTLAEIRQRLANDWRAQTRAAREAAAYQALLDGYEIRIIRP